MVWDSEGDALDDAAVDTPPPVVELGDGEVGVPEQVLALLDGDALVQQGGNDHDADGVRHHVVVEANRGEPALEHGPDGGAGDRPAGERAPSERATTEGRGRHVFGDPGRFDVRLEPLVQVVAHEDRASYSVYLAEAKGPALLVNAQVTDPWPAKRPDPAAGDDEGAEHLPVQESHGEPRSMPSNSKRA